jgi:cyclic pyranopterin phosphate synthase
MSEFTHLDEKGRVRMVDVTDKPRTDRKAVAEGTVTMSPSTLKLIADNGFNKGNVLETARIAGIMAAKNTASLIPMCHPIAITHASVDFTFDEPASAIHIRSEVRVKGETGVEMEAMTAVAIAALTVYDMCKSKDRAMTLSNIRLSEKSGGKSGHFIRDPEL